VVQEDPVDPKVWEVMKEEVAVVAAEEAVPVAMEMAMAMVIPTTKDETIGGMTAWDPISFGGGKHGATATTKCPTAAPPRAPCR